MSIRIVFNTRPGWSIFTICFVLTACVARADEPWLYVGPDERRAADEISEALAQATTMEFIETPLTDVLHYLKDLHAIPIEIDKAALKTEGIDSDEPITMNLNGVSLASALRLMLGQLKLAYVIRHEVLLITTQTAAKTHTEVRVYNTSGLLEEAGSTRELAALLEELSAVPTAGNAGPYRKVLPYGRFLVVRDTAQGHEALATILRTLRTAMQRDGQEPADLKSRGAAGEVDSRQPPLCRDAATLQSRLAAHGGTQAGQAAVSAGLKWLATHQGHDGSWSFDHAAGPCQGRCKNPGELPDARIAATSLALLPFLGAGQTHVDGKYKLSVSKGLEFLMRSIKRSAAGADLSESGGVMYSHGLATLALCEAYGLTGDRQLLPAAQSALDFIANAQDPQGGGWRYTPRQPGDTSVSGWQIMALYTGRRAGLKVPDATLKSASRFLDGVQADGGAGYGYTTPASRETTSAIGLLCRTYEGWNLEREAFARGVRNIAKRSPVRSGLNHYHNFFANQCLFRATGGDGTIWKSWHIPLRERLIRSQLKRDHETGSWYYPGDHGAARGGRLYCTALALLCLEVYYR